MSSTSAPRRGGDRLGRQAVERRLKPGPSPATMSRRASDRPGSARPDRRDKRIEVDDDRAGETDRPRRAWRATEQRRTPTELDAEIHHDPLALGIDRRVGDLGEGLAEVIGDGSVEPAAAGVGVSSPMLQSGSWPSRAIVLMSSRARSASRPARWRRTWSVGRARPARRTSPRSGRRGSVAARRGSATRERPGLGLGVLEDPPSARVDEQQLARPESAAPDRLGRGEWDGTCLRRHRNQLVAGDREGRWPQSIPIDEGADPPAVGEDDRRRAVPRGEEAGRPPAQGRDMRDAVRAAGPGPRGSRSAAPA